MKKFRVPILTEEYVVNVYIGKQDELINEAHKYTKESKRVIEKTLSRCRGLAINTLDGSDPKAPLLLLHGDIPAHIALATMAHEASHCIDYIVDYISLDDRSGEFRAHGIAAIMRAVTKTFLKK